MQSELIKLIKQPKQLNSTQFLPKLNPITSMSLLMSTHITRQNQYFLNRLERHYQKRVTSSLSSYKPKNKSVSVNPIKDQTEELDKKWITINNQMLEIMKNFIFDMKEVLHQIEDQSKFYKALKFMKDNQFFWDVSSMINTQIAKNNQNLLSQLESQKAQIVSFRKAQLNKKSQSAQIEQVQKSKDKYFDSFVSLSENLYYRAKSMSEKDFIKFCDNILMKDKIVIKSISTPRTDPIRMNNKRQDVSQSSKVDFQKINTLFQELKRQENNCSTQQRVQYLKNQVLQILQKQTAAFVCDKACCKFSQDMNFNKIPTKASVIMNSTQSKKFKQVYKNDKSEQYFRRYYRKNSFQMEKVTSVEKTKVEQMQKLQKQYQRKIQMRKKYSFCKGR